MSRIDWIQAGGILSMCSIVVGLFCGLFIKGMEPAVFVGTIPGVVYGIACNLTAGREHRRIRGRK